ncbi:hypothetical protein ACOSP7_028777 [Xanthoceras sorbifolium]
MESLGFIGGYVSRIMSCVSSASYAFLVNGEPRGKMVPSIGLRQGCPLSPYIFLLCAEGLSLLLTQAERWGCLLGIKGARSALSISHLFFTDDNLIFVRATWEESSTKRFRGSS